MTRFAVVLSIVLAVGLPRAALAQSLAQSQTQGSNPLHDICSSMLEQGAGGVSGNHTKLCNCLVHETSTRLSNAEMVAYSQASAEGQAPPKAVMDKVMKIATYCLQQAQ